MRDHDDRGAGRVELLQQRDEGVAGGAVEVAGGLVGEHDRRPVDQGAGDRHPLALAAGELRRPGRRAVGQADGGQRLERAPAAQSGRRARVEQAVGDVVQRGRVLGQEELLEDEADAGGAQRGELPVGQRARRPAR